MCFYGLSPDGAEIVILSYFVLFSNYFIILAENRIKHEKEMNKLCYKMVLNFEEETLFLTKKITYRFYCFLYFFNFNVFQATQFILNIVFRSLLIQLKKF